MRFLLTIIFVVALLAAGVVFYAWSGRYNIAATQPHWAVTTAFLEMLKDRSIAAHSAGIQAPDLNDPQVADAAFGHYHGMCRRCHGAPQVPPDEFAKGLYPSPPGMTEGHIQEERGPGQLYWIVKHGLKMTGMPAFGPTHDEKQLWGLVAIVREMPAMTAAQYRRKIDAMDAPGGTGHGHGHAESGAGSAPNNHDHTDKE
jgi:mono/diheme cytochrome c family protein